VSGVMKDLTGRIVTKLIRWSWKGQV